MDKEYILANNHVLKSKVKRLMVFGDLHLDDFKTTMHKDLWQTSKEVMENVLSLVDENKPDLVVFSGDVLGVVKRSSLSKVHLLEVINFFSKLPMTVLLEGNHIQSGGDFDIIVNSLSNVIGASDLGSLDIMDEETKVAVRLHFQDYGRENSDLDLLKSSVVEGFTKLDIVIAHNDFHVSAVDYGTSYNQNAIDLVKHEPWQDVELVMSGHIHQEQPPISYKNFKGNEQTFINLGALTRTTRRDTGEYGRYVLVDFNVLSNINVKANTFNLPKYEDVFLEAKADELDSLLELGGVSEEERLEKLKEVLTIHRDNSIELRGEFIHLLDNMQGLKPSVKEICLRYYNAEKGEL